MCRLFLSLFLLCCGLWVQGQSRIRGQIKNFYPTEIRLQLPQAGAYVPVRPLTVPVDDDGHFDIALNTTGSGFVSFYHYGDAREMRFWITPGSDDQMVFDWEEPLATFRFSGTHEAVNGYLNSPELLRTYLPEDEPWVKAVLQASPDPAMRQAAIESLKRQERTRLEKLNEAKPLDPDWYQLAQSETDYFWDYLLMSEPLSSPERGGVRRTEGSRGGKGKMAVLSDESAIKSRYYFLYLQAYFEQQYPEADHGERLARAARQLEAPVLHAFRANYLYNHADYGDRHYALVPALVAYKKDYPGDVSTELLTWKINPIEDKYEMERQPITADMEIVEDLSAYESLEDLIAQYKGEVLYFDIWATWCKPCIQEFQMRYARPLKQFIKGKPVRIVYLSFDRDASHTQWMKAVKNYKLNGLNVHVPDSKAQAIRDLLGNGSHPLFAIPRYFIIDKEGNMVNKEAPRPSQKDLLFAELAKYL